MCHTVMHSFQPSEKCLPVRRFVTALPFAKLHPLTPGLICSVLILWIWKLPGKQLDKILGTKFGTIMSVIGVELIILHF